MQRAQTMTMRAFSWLAAAWFAVGLILETDALAVPYDPFVKNGAGSGPWISNQLPAAVRRKLESAVELVVQRLAERPSCAHLFAELGEDGTKVIRRTLYYPASALMERKVCWRALAFTKVGVRPTWICRRMWLKSVSRFALVLLHEALHHAGLEEWPNSHVADDSREITGRVATACGF